MAVKSYYAYYHTYSDSELFKEYVDSLVNLESDKKAEVEIARRKAYNFVSALKKYLAWREITVEEMIANDKTEELFLDKFIEDNNVILTILSKKAIVRRIKNFLRFCGVKLQRNNHKKMLFFANDEIMIKHLNNDVGQAITTQRAINRAIALYCQFRKEFGDKACTPTLCIEEIKKQQISIDELKDKLLGFYNWRKGQEDNSNANKNTGRKISDSFAWEQMNKVLLFYQHRANIYVQTPTNRKPKDENLLSLPMGFGNQSKVVTKEIMRKLLQAADLRTSVALMIMFESGINPVDLCSLQYHHFYEIENGMKINHLDLKNPYNIPQDKIVLIQHRRAKTSREFLVPVSGKTLQMISLFLKARKEGKYGYPDSLTDDSYIFCSEKYPYRKAQTYIVNKILTKCSEKVNIESHLPCDFRNSFISRMKVLTYDSVVKVIVGHALGLDKNYVIFDKDTKTNLEKGIINAYLEYVKCWKKLFDLDNTETIEEKVKEELKEQNQKLEQKFIEMKLELEELKDLRNTRAEMYEQEMKERQEILETQSFSITEKLTKEEMQILRKLIAKISS